MGPVAIAIVDGHPLMVYAIHSLLERTKGFHVVGIGADLVNVCMLHQPQVAIVDPIMPGDMYLATRDAIKVSPSTKIVAFTGAPSIESAIRILDAGATGYVLKRNDSAELIAAILSVQSGKTYITPSFASRVIKGLQNASLRRKAAEAISLSIREQQIVRLLMRGKTNKEIALKINLSEKTLKYYMGAMMQKLQVRNRVEMLIAAQRIGDGQPYGKLHS